MELNQLKKKINEFIMNNLHQLKYVKTTYVANIAAGYINFSNLALGAVMFLL